MKGVESRKQIRFHRMHTLKIIALAYNVDREESRRCFLEENFIIYLSFMMFIILVLINLVIFFFLFDKSKGQTVTFLSYLSDSVLKESCVEEI